ncbi:MAG: PrgI family protein [bacterium]|nr:PrgI family protein [bacterium]
MEHPIPQNVTTFEFHLVGDMTLKQFGYLGGGAALAYLSYVLIFPLNPYIAAPLIALFAVLGASFAFLPILDRPLDHWVGAFFKAVYSPTQGVWQNPGQKGRVNPLDPFFKNRLQSYLSSLIPQSSIIPAAIPVLKIPPPQPFTPPIKLDLVRPAPAHPLPSPEELNKLITMAKQSQALQIKIVETEKQISLLKSQLETARAEVSGHIVPTTSPAPASAPQFQQMVGNLQTLIQQTQNLYQQNTQIERQTLSPTLTPSAHKAQVVVIQPPKATNTQLALTSSPNVMNGVVTSAEGAYLEGVIVIIHNREGLPVRALKTNKLGQFAGATPLPSGTYTITLEKEGLEFDTLQLTLNGEALLPVMIRAKKGAVA